MPQTGQSGSVDESVAADIQSNQSEWNLDFMTRGERPLGTRRRLTAMQQRGINNTFDPLTLAQGRAEQCGAHAA
jgi:hypothetical protein